MAPVLVLSAAPPATPIPEPCGSDRKSTRLNSSHTVIYTLSLHDALPISLLRPNTARSCEDPHGSGIGVVGGSAGNTNTGAMWVRSEEHTSELQSHSDLHSFPTRRSSDLLVETKHRPIV